MTHTPEPWSISDAPYQIVGPVGQTIAKLTSLDMDNARRIVAAVNAVAGMPQDDLEELAKVEGGVMSLTVYADDMRQRVEKLEADYAAQGLALKAAKAMQAGETERADKAEAQHDQLLAALYLAHEHAKLHANYRPGWNVYDLVEAAIAAVKGGAA